MLSPCPEAFLNPQFLRTDRSPEGAGGMAGQEELGLCPWTGLESGSIVPPSRVYPRMLQTPAAQPPGGRVGP